MLKQFLIGSASTAAILAIMPGHAQAASSADARIAALQKQIQAQQDQLQQQQQMLTSLMASEEQTKATVAKTAAAIKPAAKPSAIAVMSASHKPGWRSADGRNEIDLGALLQVDGSINRYHTGNKAAGLQKLQSGINARRAQIQVTGTFDDDWHFALQYDLGGSNEQFGASAGGVTSGFKSALLTYTGIKPWGTNLSLEFGYTSPPITLDSSIPSNAGLFVEHPAPDRLSTGISGGPGRGELGFRDFTNTWFTYFAFSGPKSGDVHDSTEGAMPITAIGRVNYMILNGKDLKFQLGGTFQRYLQLANGKYSLADEAEDRVDPTTFIGVAVPTTAANPVQSGGTEAVELAGQAGPFFATGSYIRYDAERKGLKENDFWGAYGDVMYSITGEKHPHLPSGGGWGNISPAHPFSLKTGGIGAWEIGVRYSYADFNSNLGTASAVQGGHFNDAALGVNWYVNNNIRFQLNWMHGFEGGLLGATGSATQQSGTKITVANGHWDEIAIRSQFSF